MNDTERRSQPAATWERGLAWPADAAALQRPRRVLLLARHLVVRGAVDPELPGRRVARTTPLRLGVPAARRYDGRGDHPLRTPPSAGALRRATAGTKVAITATDGTATDRATTDRQPAQPAGRTGRRSSADRRAGAAGLPTSAASCNPFRHGAVRSQGWLGEEVGGPAARAGGAGRPRPPTLGDIRPLVFPHRWTLGCARAASRSETRGRGRSRTAMDFPHGPVAVPARTLVWSSVACRRRDSSRVPVRAAPRAPTTVTARQDRARAAVPVACAGLADRPHGDRASRRHPRNTRACAPRHRAGLPESHGRVRLRPPRGLPT